MTQQGDDLDDDMPPGNPFAPTSPTAAASGAPGEASSGRVNEGRLLQVLESLTTLVQSQAQSSASADAPQIRGRDLTKVLRPPDPFKPKDRDGELSLWASWSWDLEQYLGCLDKNFAADLQMIRRKPAIPIMMHMLEPDRADRSRLLYGILAGLLHERGKRLLKSVKESNGYEAYRMLIQDLTPSSRSRVLALMQAIHNWPTFDAKTGVMVQLSKFESAVAECENLSNSKLSDDNKLAAVLRCLTGQLRTQATVLITETFHLPRFARLDRALGYVPDSLEHLSSLHLRH